MRYHAGIDIGFHGAITVIGPDGDWLFSENLPTLPGPTRYNARECVALAGRVLDIAPFDLCVTIEKAKLFPGTANYQSISSLFICQGIWEGLFGLEEVELVEPNVWKKALGLSKDKGESFAMARSLWPEDVAALRGPIEQKEGRVEAALLAEWCRRGREVVAPKRKPPSPRASQQRRRALL